MSNRGGTHDAPRVHRGGFDADDTKSPPFPRQRVVCRGRWCPWRSGTARRRGPARDDQAPVGEDPEHLPSTAISGGGSARGRRIHRSSIYREVGSLGHPTNAGDRRGRHQQPLCWTAHHPHRFWRSDRCACGTPHRLLRAVRNGACQFHPRLEGKNQLPYGSSAPRNTSFLPAC